MLAADRRVRNYIQLGKLTIEEFETQANDQSRWTPVRVRRQEEGVEQGRPTAAAPHSHSLVCRRRPASSAAHSCNGPGAGHRPPRDSVVAAEGERGQERRGLLRQDGGDVLLHPSHGLRPDLEGARHDALRSRAHIRGVPGLIQGCRAISFVYMYYSTRNHYYGGNTCTE